MYRRFYGLQEQPFSLRADPQFFFLGKQYASAKTMLDYAALRREGISVITGETGCGKSMLVRAFLADAPDNLVLGAISNPALLEDSPIHGVNLAFRLDPGGAQTVQLHADLHGFLRNKYAAGRAVMLIVDEAQHLSPVTLERLRMLTNPEADGEGALQLVLVGQSQLRHTLNHPQLNQLHQRVLVSLHLEPLNEDDTLAYILHRLQTAGAERRIFTDAALAAVYRGSRGVPRLINMICDMALLYGYAEEMPVIDEEVIDQVIADRGLGGSDPAMLPSSLDAAPHDEVAPRRQVDDPDMVHGMFGVPGGKK